jgi:hypothetical protein
MHKTLIVRENKADIVLRICVKTSNGASTREIARFTKCGMGYAALGAAGRAITSGVGSVDAIKFNGRGCTYDMLVHLGVIEPQQAAA